MSTCTMMEEEPHDDPGNRIEALEFCNVLRDDGITYHQYVTELTYILFLKMEKRRGQRARSRKAIAGTS